MKKKGLLFIVFLILVLPKSVFGLTATPDINCNKTSVYEGEEISCDISINVDSLTASITANVEVNSNLELLTPSIVGMSNEDGVTGNISLGTIKLKALSSGTGTVTLNNIKVNEQNFSSISKNITIEEEVVVEETISLTSLSVEDEALTPEFDKDVTTYSLTTKKESITINATSDKGTISGTGSKTLKVGSNKYIIKVVDGDLSKEYTINVTREEEEKKIDTTLKKIALSVGKINFKPDQYEYDVVLDNKQSSVKVTAEPTDKDAKIKFSPNSTISLDEGETKTVVITVTGTGDDSSEYTLNITREEKKEEKTKSNANLSSLTVKGVEFTFSPSTLTYNLSVENDITHADIEYETEDPNSEVSILGNTTLKVGLNTINVVVTGKSGNTKTYTLHITRNKSRVVLSNNEEEIINKLNENDEEEDIYINVLKTEDKEITTNILEALNKTKKTLIYEVMNDDNGLVYSASFKGNKFKTEESFNYELMFVSENDENISKLINSNVYLPISFKSTNELPGKVLYNIFVKDKAIKDVKEVNLYKFDASSNELELVKEGLKVKDGYVEVELEENSEYVLAQIEKSKKTLNENFLIPVILLPLLLITVVVCLLIQKKKNKKSNK